MPPHYMLRAAVADVKSHLLLRNAGFPHLLEQLVTLRRPKVAYHSRTIRS